LTNNAQSAGLFGRPLIPLGTMLDWVAVWVGRAMPAYDKPTKFEVRNGVF
jgi:hypothetical protein